MQQASGSTYNRATGQRTIVRAGAWVRQHVTNPG
jgi:hypothetical protein